MQKQGLDEEAAIKDVDKFLLDAKRVNSYIKYERDKVENPPKGNPASLIQLLAIYGAWLLVGDRAIDWLRTDIVAPKIASGEWQEMSIPPFLRPDRIAESLSQAVSGQVDAAVLTASGALSSTVDLVSTNADTIQTAIDAASTSL